MACPCRFACGTQILPRAWAPLGWTPLFASSCALGRRVWRACKAVVRPCRLSAGLPPTPGSSSRGGPRGESARATAATPTRVRRGPTPVSGLRAEARSSFARPVRPASAQRPISPPSPREKPRPQVEPGSAAFARVPQLTFALPAARACGDSRPNEVNHGSDRWCKHVEHGRVSSSSRAGRRAERPGAFPRPAHHSRSRWHARLW